MGEVQAKRSKAHARRERRARQRAAPLAFGLLTFAAFAWAGNHVLARAVANKVPVWSLNTVRWLLVAALMALVAAPALYRDWPLIRRHWPPLAFLGVLGGGLFGVLQFIGLKYTNALNVSVMNSVAPALIALASVAIFRDPLSLLQCAGITISLGGVLAIVSKLDLGVLGGFAFNGGDVIIVINMGIWAIYSACLRLRPPIAGTSFLFMLAVWAAVTTLPGAVLEIWEGDYLLADAMTLGTLAYSSVLSSSLAYIAWGRGIEILGVTRAGAFLHLVPLFGAGLATTLLGETLGVHHVVGFVLILTGVSLAVGRGRRAAGPRDQR